jgi:hypothetical protein
MEDINTIAISVLIDLAAAFAIIKKLVLPNLWQSFP